MFMNPTVSRIVHYMLTETDAHFINRRRQHARESNISANHSGAQVHVGSDAHAGDVLPMIITKVDGNLVSGQVFLDGNDTLWKSEVRMISYLDPKNHYGCWSWPPRV